jgi:DNA-binding CsgD family transcriptional regulator
MTMLSDGAFISLALVWDELSRGLCKVRDAYFSDSRCFLVTVATAGPPVAVDEYRLRILENVLVGGGQKGVAIDMDVSPSTVACNARMALEQMGVRCRASRVHPLLLLSAKAAHARDFEATAALTHVTRGEARLRVISIVRPDCRLAEVLPSAELAVAHCFIEGLCYRDIARRRGTSRRTVANQIASVFRRFKVSGRDQLLTRLCSG